MTNMKVLLENFKKYSMKEEESVSTDSPYDFTRDKEIAEDKISKKGFKNIEVKYEEGYEDKRASSQSDIDFKTDTSHGGQVKGEFFMPIEPSSIQVSDKTLMDNIFQAVNKQFGTEVFGIIPSFVKDPTKLAGILFKLQSVPFRFDGPEGYQTKQLDSALDWYKTIDNRVEEVKQVALDELGK